MPYPDTWIDYLIDLQLDLQFNQDRLETADPETVPVILRNIDYLEGEIKEVSAKLQDTL